MNVPDARDAIYAEVCRLTKHKGFRALASNIDTIAKLNTIAEFLGSHELEINVIRKSLVVPKPIVSGLDIARDIATTTDSYTERLKTLKSIADERMLQYILEHEYLLLNPFTRPNWFDEYYSFSR